MIRGDISFLLYEQAKSQKNQGKRADGRYYHKKIRHGRYWEEQQNTVRTAQLTVGRGRRGTSHWMKKIKNRARKLQNGLV